MSEHEDRFVPRVAAYLPSLDLAPERLADGYSVRDLFPSVGFDGAITPRFPEALRERSRVMSLGRKLAQSKGWRPPQWSAHVWITPQDGVSAAEAVARLRSVETGEGTVLFVEPESYPAGPVSPGDPLSRHQGYLRAAPEGVDAAFAWSRPGGTGEGVSVWVLEQAYPELNGKITLDELDGNLFVELGHSCHADPAVLASNRRHGAATLGVIAAEHGQGDFAGLAPDVRLRLACERPAGCGTPCCPPELADALLQIATRASAGDIVLVESQLKVDDTWLTDRFPDDVVDAGGDPDWFAPVEVDPAVYDAIRLLVVLGVTVVEPAGNGGLSLQTIAADGLVVFGAREPSGAILVGAADAATRQPKESSNRGGRIDCYAWGDSVGTTSWSSHTPRDGITTNYSGTSAAGAIIAGCAAIVQGVSRARFGRLLGPDELRRVLANPETGTPCVDPEGGESAEIIGVMPNLAAILDRIEQVPDVVVRDNLQDEDGILRGGQRVTNSPDIACAPLVGRTPMWPDVGYPPAQVVASEPHGVSVRARNRGTVVARNVTAKVFHAPVATLVTPRLWSPIGLARWTDDLEPGEEATSTPITWRDVPARGPRAFAALITCDGDDTGPELDDWEGFLTALTRSSNLAIRNVHRLDVVTPATRLDAWVTGAPGEDALFGLQVIVRLPGDADPHLVLPAELAARLRVVGASPSGGLVRVPLRQGIQRLGRGVLRGDAHYGVQVELGLKRALDRHGLVVIRQLFAGTEVGRITWRLFPRGRD